MSLEDVAREQGSAALKDFLGVSHNEDGTIRSVGGAIPVTMPAPSGSDDSAAVLAELAAAAGDAAGDIAAIFQPGTYNLALGTFGAGGELGGRNIRFTAQHPYLTRFAPASTTDPIFTVLGSGDTTSDYFEMDHIGIQGSAADRDPSKPLIVCKLLHGFDFHHLRLASADGNSYTGTWIQIDSCFEGDFDKIQARTGKYGVPVEILNVTDSPYGVGPPQIDTIGFRRFVVDGCQGVIVRDGVKEVHGLVFDRYKVVNTSFYATNPNVETTLNGATVAGATSVVVASATGIVVGDCITVDHSDTFEVAKVTGVAGTTLTLSQPLQFAHATGMPVMVGGWALSLADNVHSVSMVGYHFEGQMVGVGAGAVGALDLSGFSAAGEVVRVNGNTQKIRLGATSMYGTTNKNTTVQRASYNVASTDGYWVLDGPFFVPTGAPLQNPVINPPHNTRNWSARYQSSLQINETTNVATTSATAGDRHTIQVNGAAVAKITHSGSGRFTDGVQTKYASGAGKTTVTDADFTQVPTDGTLAVHRDTTAGRTYMSVRSNGAWTVVAGPL